MSEDRTLKEWRELRGLSREDLAQRLGLTALMVERWEEVGLDAEPGSRYGDYLVGRIFDALDIDGSLNLEDVPSEPNPGDVVIRPEAGLDIDELLKLAEEPDAVRIAVPNEWGLSLKPIGELAEEDHAALVEHFRQERAYSERMVERLDNTLDMLGGNDGTWKPGQTVRDRLEDLDREIGEDLRDSGGRLEADEN